MARELQQYVPELKIGATIRNGSTNMLASENTKPASLERAQQDETDESYDRDLSGVPVSERGKGENMLWDKRHPSWVLALVGGTFFLILLVALLVMMIYS